MNANQCRNARAPGVLFGVLLLTGCSSAVPSSSSSPVIVVLDSEVVSHQTPQSISFTVATRIRNTSRTRALRRACGTRVEKRDGTAWRSVFAELCAGSSGGMQGVIAPGDSTVEKVTVSGFTSSSSLPRFDFGDAIAGDYRLWLNLEEILSNGQPGRMQTLASNAFRLR